MNIYVFFLPVIAYCIIQILGSNHEIIVTTTSMGKIRGYLQLSYGKRYYEAYEGIPYAQPPTDELRFQPPIPIHKMWTDELDATTKRSCCTQFDHKNNVMKGKEDCLYMNIYKPRLINDINNKKLPVIFWIHGGGYQYGTGNDVDAKYLMDRDLILVAVNYRLGPFGFLSTGTTTLSGNQGLKDQNIALLWIYEHIASFGGDPSRISLFGVSAGGSSVHYHYLAPSSRGLFRNGVSFSGTALSGWAYTSNPRKGFDKLVGKVVDCEDNGLDEETVDCLRRMSADKLNEAAREVLRSEYLSIGVITPSFQPVAETNESDYFIDRSPEEILLDGNQVYDVPWITGITSEEGIFFTSGFILNATSMSYVDENWDTVAPYLIQFEDKIPNNELARVARLSRDWYRLDDRLMTIENETIWKLTYLVGDKVVAYDSQKAAIFQARVSESPVRFYYYNYRAERSLSDHLTKSRIDFGVCHADDVYLVIENDSGITTEADKAMLNDMLDFWYSVANTGKPDLRIRWPRINSSSDELDYVHIFGPNNFVAKRSDDLGEKKFWRSIGF